MENNPRITFGTLLLLLLISIIIPLVSQTNIVWDFLLVFFVLFVFIIFVFPVGVWLFAAILVMIGTLLPYKFHLVSFYTEHLGGAYPHPVISPTYMVVIISFLLMLIFYNSKIKNVLNIRLSLVFLSWLIFSIYSFMVSLISADSLLASFYELIRMIVALYIYSFIILIIDKQEKANQLYIAICLILIFESIIAVLQYFRVLPLDLILGEEAPLLQFGFITQVFRRVRGSLRVPNIFGQLLSLFIPIFFASLLINKGKVKIFSIIAILFSIIALLMTFSRSAIACTVFAIAFTLFFINKFAHQYMPSKKILLSGLGMFIISVSAGIMFLAQLLFLRFITFGLLTVPGRLAQIENAIYIIKNHLLFGIGLNNYFIRMVMEDYTGIAAASPRYVVHNIYLLYFAETGILGFILFLIFIYSIFHENLKKLKFESLHPISLAIIIGGLSGIISVLLQGVLDWGFRTVNMYHLFYLLGVMYSLKKSQ